MPRPDLVTIKQLRAFAAVCEHGSISRAAEQLSLSPPAIHTQLKSLESAMNTRLLNRSRAQGMTPTEAGKSVLLANSKIAAALDHAVEEVRAANAGLRGFVRLGVVSTAKYFAPKVIAILERELPDVEIDLVVGNRKQTVEALSTGRLDFAIMGRPPRLPGLHESRLGPNPHVLVCRPDSPVLRHEAVTANDILSQRIILREDGSGTRILTQRFLDRIGEGSLYSAMVMESNETIKQAVLAGLGIAVLSAHTVMDELLDKRLATIAFPSLPIVRTWYLVSIADLPLDGARRTFSDRVLANREEFLRIEELNDLMAD